DHLRHFRFLTVRFIPHSAVLLFTHSGHGATRGEGRHSLCRACRYKKCLEVGMNKELIQLPKNYDTDRIGREQFVLNNDPNRPISIRPIMRDLFHTDGGQLAAVVGSLLYAETQSDFLRRSTFDPSENTINSLIDLINAPNQLANSQKYKLVAEWPAKQAPPMDRHGDGLPCTAKNWLLCDLVLTVEFAKSFNAFKRLSLHDKLVLLRNAAAANFSMMQSYYS
uniref:Nuclear receptor domain-containing protein n=1 Tax=Parascaris univalens TaxID=6257 RepID=A0A915A7G7_PARUN